MRKIMRAHNRIIQRSLVHTMITCNKFGKVSVLYVVIWNLCLIFFVHFLLFVCSRCLEVLGKEKFDKVQKYCERNGVPEMRYCISGL